MNWEAISAIGTVGSAIGTIGAVILSLHFARENKKIVKDLNITQQFTERFEEGKIKKIITIENLGNAPIIINEYGTGNKSSNMLYTDINKYLIKSSKLILIKAGDATLIEYEHSYNHKFKEGEKSDTPEYKLLEKNNFKVRDTLGNTYV